MSTNRMTAVQAASAPCPSTGNCLEMHYQAEKSMPRSKGDVEYREEKSDLIRRWRYAYWFLRQTRRYPVQKPY
jgi:hypothetical protein